MAAKTKIKVPVQKSDARFVLISAAIITLFFFTSLRDPFNAPKLWLNILLGAFLLGHLVMDSLGGRLAEGQNTLRILAAIVGVFVIFMLLSALTSDVKYISFFGDNQRNTGWLDYFFLAVFVFSAAKHIRLRNLNMVFWFGIGVGAVMTEYGILQHFGHDFVKWNNPYNSIISTVGNPDFAGGIMAMFLTFSCVAVIVAPWKIWIRAVVGVQAAVTLLVINWSNARQGLLSFALGAGIFVIIWLWHKKRLLGQLSLLGGVIVFIVALAGIFQKGPLASYLYKTSVSIRGFYWRAGADMFIHHPWFGVGPDRYGAWFRQYRADQYPMNYGYDLTSTASHNVVIQIFATCGIFVGLAYLGLLGFVVYRGIVGIKKNSGSNRMLVAGLLAAWIGYQSQSIVSIDNVGIAIWGWVLSGIVIGVSMTDVPEIANQVGGLFKRQSSLSTFKPVVSWAFVLAFLFLVIPQYRGESNTFHLSAYAVPTSAQGQATRDAYHQLVTSDLSVPMLNPQYRLMMASNLAQAGYVDEAFAQINGEIKSDPRDYAAYGMEASFYEQLHQFTKAVAARTHMYDLDPWGAQNVMTLANDYLSAGDKQSARKYWQIVLDIGSHGKPPVGSAYLPLEQQAKQQLAA
jgi:O-antigen ligase